MFEGLGFAGLTFVLKRWCDFGVIFKQPVPTTTLDCYVLSVTVLWVVSDIILPTNPNPTPPPCLGHATAFFTTRAGYRRFSFTNAPSRILSSLWCRGIWKSWDRLHVPTLTTNADKEGKRDAWRRLCMQLKMQAAFRQNLKRAWKAFKPGKCKWNLRKRVLQFPTERLRDQVGPEREREGETH